MNPDRKRRFLRLTVALGVAGLISAQIPMQGGTALAKDGYPLISGKFLGSNVTNEQAFTGVTLGVLGGALFKGLRDGRHGATTASSTGGTVAPPVAPNVTALKIPLLGDAERPIYDVVSGIPSQFSGIKGLIDDCGDMVGSLKNDGPFTFLAPDNGILGNVSPSTVSALRADKGKLCELLQNHTLIGRYKYEDLVRHGNKNLLTLSGNTVKLTQSNGKVYIEGHEVVPSDIAASNGWVHDLKGVIQK
jgi:uncharacterized surface protein with fasciclin (FAS1) repeats